MFLFNVFRRSIEQLSELTRFSVSILQHSMQRKAKIALEAPLAPRRRIHFRQLSQTVTRITVLSGCVALISLRNRRSQSGDESVPLQHQKAKLLHRRLQNSTLAFFATGGVMKNPPGRERAVSLTNHQRVQQDLRAVFENPFPLSSFQFNRHQGCRRDFTLSMTKRRFCHAIQHTL